MNDRRYLIVNADDLGYSARVNGGIFEAHQRGIVTSASLMVRWPAAAAAVAAARRCPGLSLGMHLDLGEWSYCDGEWFELYSVVDLKNHAAVEREVQRQLALFRELTGQNPTHLDSHQHVHRQEPAQSIVREVGHQLRVPVRHESACQYCGDFYGQTGIGEPLDDAILVDSLLSVLKNLPAGFTEISCHPGFAEELDTMYTRQRSVEVATLCSPVIREAIDEWEIELVSFYDLALTNSSQAAAAYSSGPLLREATA
jgi:predicted glycoside hydrolase/deacetylase ChbG (UPF0249 family)